VQNYRRQKGAKSDFPPLQVNPSSSLTHPRGSAYPQNVLRQSAACAQRKGENDLDFSLRNMR